MKYINFLVLCATLTTVLSCSSNDNEENSIIPDQTRVRKYLHQMTGDIDHLFNYENGKINKVWLSSSSTRSQMEYNSNGTLSKIYNEITSTPQNNLNFEWEIPTSNNFIEYVYDGKKRLREIRKNNGGESYKLVEYSYSEDFVTIKRNYRNKGELFRICNYLYDNQRKIKSIFWSEKTDSWSSHLLTVTSDENPNPYYDIWNESKLIFSEIQDPARFNMEFHPFNVLKLEEVGGDTWYEASYTYDEDNYPTIINITVGDLAGRNYFLEYQ